MEDGAFIALAEAFIRWTDERYGRVAAWIAAIGTVTVGLGLVWFAMLWAIAAFA